MHPTYVSAVRSPSCRHNRFLAWKTVFRDGTGIIWRQTTLFLSWRYHSAVRHLAFICPGHHCLNPGPDLFPLKLFLYIPSWLLSPLLNDTYFTLLLAVSVKIYIYIYICMCYIHIYLLSGDLMGKYNNIKRPQPTSPAPSSTSPAMGHAVLHSTHHMLMFLLCLLWRTLYSPAVRPDL